MRMRAIWNGAVLAESDDTIVVEGNHYFPRSALRDEYFHRSSHTSFCGWKGTASYYSISVDGADNANAAWEYESPSLLARKVKDRVAFWHGVQVVPVDETSDQVAPR